MLLEHIKETTAFIKEKTSFVPQVGIVLGSGLTALADEIDVEYAFLYEDIPHFPVSTVQGHGKKLLLGKLEGTNVIALTGRFHFYEGYSMQQLTFPVRVMRALGAAHLFVSNASGSVNPKIITGDIMLINDHINLMGDNPLIGPNHNELGPRFPDMLRAYNHSLNKKVLQYARQQQYRVHEGIYLGVKGPNLETPAEYAAFHRIGADAVGMSTVPEVLVGVHAGMKVFGVSVISDQGYPPEVLQVTTHQKVVEVARKATPTMIDLVKFALTNLN